MMAKAIKQDKLECPICNEIGTPCEIWIDKYGYRSLSFVKCAKDGKFYFLNDTFSTDEEFERWRKENKL